MGASAAPRAIARVVVLAVVLAGCTAGDPAVQAGGSAGTAASAGSGIPDPAGVTDPSGPVGGAELAAVTALITRINDAAGSVTDQQAVLRAAVHPDFTAGQLACAPATIAVRLDPVFDELRPDAGWRPAGSSVTPSGLLLRVPTLVEVYSAGLRTGTDLTLLRVAVLDGTAHTFPLCLV